VAWERRKGGGGRYYTRSRRVGGRVVREYVGCGIVGRLAAELDAQDRTRRTAEVEALRQYRAQLGPSDETIMSLAAACTLIVEATLLAAGLYRHGGEWRPRGGRSNPNKTGRIPCR
jgi:hypothetical protein